MPKIVIQELDKTLAGTNSSVDFNVLIPGDTLGPNKYYKIVGDTVQEIEVPAGQTPPVDYDYYTADGNAYEFTKATIKHFDAVVGSANTSMCYKIARKLIELGMTVLYAFCSDSTKLKSYANWWKKFADKSVYDIRFITSGGGTADKEVYKAMAQCASARGDAVALIDVPEKWVLTPAGGESTTYKEWSQESIDNYINLELSGISAEEAKYCAGFGPGAVIEAITYPGSFAYLACFATYAKTYESWFAFAGPVRGAIPYTTKLPVLFGDADVDVLQDRTTAGHRGCNVICPIKPYGNLVWGNRTMYPNKATTGSTEADLIASSFLNIRMLCCDIKKTLYKASRSLTFEPNSDILWTKFTSAITPLLERMKAGQGIRGYQIVKKAGKDHESYETKKGTLCATIRIIPIEAVEDFYLTVMLEDSIEVVEE